MSQNPDRPTSSKDIEALKERARELYLGGKTVKEVAAIVHRSPPTVRTWIQEKGVTVRSNRDIASRKQGEAITALKETATNLYADGVSMDKIAAIVGRSKSTVKKWLQREGVDIRGNTDRILNVTVELSRELEAIPEGERRQFCLDAIAKALAER